MNTKPAITSVDIVTGSIFTGNNSGAYGDPGNNTSHPLIWVDGTTTLSGTVPANGRLATLTFDTTGLNSGTFPLKLTGVASSLGSFNTTLRNANGSATPLGIINGSLIVAVPYAGDFNLDGAVDASDYVIWRKGLGSTYTQNDYDAWQANFGQSIGSGALAHAAAVPEPASLILLLAGISATYPRRRVAVR